MMYTCTFVHVTVHECTHVHVTVLTCICTYLCKFRVMADLDNKLHGERVLVPKGVLVRLNAVHCLNVEGDDELESDKG